MYRAVHEMTIKGQAIAQAFYGTASRLSYWQGCSTAGNQGLKEAQLYPQDYDGITVSAPVNNWSRQMVGALYNAVTSFKNGQNAPEYLPPAKWTVLLNAALAMCDSRDGIADGIVTDPSSCNFSPASLQCPSGDASNCLTAAQVATATRIYAGGKFSNGQPFYPGLPPSSESEWAPVLEGPEPYLVAVNHFKYLVYGNPNWDWHTFNPDTAVPLADTVQSAGLNSMNPDLSAFKARGGKLIMWHGWIDPLVFAKNSVAYYQSVVNAMGGKFQTEDFFRLFMAPGVEHCGGGPGPNIIDDLAALERWVEQAIAPAQIEADHYSGGFTNGTIDRRRPLCPYPQVAAYRGTGDINAMENFFCETPKLNGTAIRQGDFRNATKCTGRSRFRRSAQSESYRRGLESSRRRFGNVCRTCCRRQRDVRWREFRYGQYG
jgi:feruloyl esterase